MRIIHVHKYFYPRAGAERFMFDLMDVQKSHGHTVIPFSMHHPKNKPTEWSSYFVSELNTDAVGRGRSLFAQFGRALWSQEAYRNMSKLIDRFQPDIVHAHNVYTHLSPSVLAACYHHGIPVVMTVHDYALLSANYALWNERRMESMDTERINWWQTVKTRFIKGSVLATASLESIYATHRLLRLYDRYIHRYHLVSDFTHRLFQEQGFDPQKLTVRHPFMQACKSLRTQDDGYVLYVGRLASYKGVQTLVQAMRAFPGVPLKIAGTGEYESQLREGVEAGQKVEFLGFVGGEQLDCLRAGARVAVVPSLWEEVFGLVPIEMMGQGVPVIVSDKGGLQESVEHGVSGTVFPAGDVEGLVAALRPYVQDEDFAHSMGEAAYQRAKELLDAEAVYEDIQDIYRSVLQQERPYLAHAREE